MSSTPRRRRPKVTATIDAELLATVDAHIAAHPDEDRSSVIDAALRLWREKQMELALEAQFAGDDDVPPAERAQWDALRRDAATRRLLSNRT